MADNKGSTSAKLTDKQKRFVDEYLIDLNATASYKRAGYQGDGATAEVNACKLLSNTKVQEYIQTRMKAREKRTEITQDKVLKELAGIAFDDIKNYLSFRTEKTVVGYDIIDDKPIMEYRTVVDLKDSETIDTRNISEITVGKDGMFKFKLYCKDNALVQVGKHLGMFKDQIEVNGNMVIFKGEDKLED